MGLSKYVEQRCQAADIKRQRLECHKHCTLCKMSFDSDCGYHRHCQGANHLANASYANNHRSTHAAAAGQALPGVDVVPGAPVAHQARGPEAAPDYDAHQDDHSQVAAPPAAAVLPVVAPQSPPAAADLNQHPMGAPRRRGVPMRPNGPAAQGILRAYNGCPPSVNVLQAEAACAGGALGDVAGELVYTEKCVLSWLGDLTPAKRGEVLRDLQNPDFEPSSVRWSTADELQRYLDKGQARLLTRFHAFPF